MTSTLSTVSLALVAALAAGCAADPRADIPGSEPRAPREYRTGSNIPVREPRATSEEDKARAVAPAEAPPAARTTN